VLPCAEKFKQAKLFEMQSCLSERLGVEIFRTLPSCPGVYFFYDQEGRLLYIGQSGNLKSRIGSYRHISRDRHPIRLRRLVSRIARLEWKECASAADAIEMERMLLLECKPPFNRAGVWVGEPWYFKVGLHNIPRRISVELSRHSEASEGVQVYGPLPSSFRYVHASLVRCLYRHWLPDLPLWQYPLGLLNFTAPLQVEFSIVDNPPEENFIQDIFKSNPQSPAPDQCVPWLDMIVEKSPPVEKTYWENETDIVKKYILSKKQAVIKEPQPTEADRHEGALNL